MNELFSRSLVFRTGATLAAIVLLALVSIVTSVVVPDRMAGDAEAINVAGSLRMQAYRIAMLLDEPGARVPDAIDDFERRLATPALVQAIADAGDPALAAEWDRLRARWRQDMRPLLTTSPVARDAYLAHVQDFVAAVDRFVRRLQYASEDKLRLLRMVQGVTLFLTLALVFGAMYGLNADVITPLHALVNAARATGRGDFRARVAHVSDDELGVLGQAFNSMADDLSRLYGELEDRVGAKTAELRRNNDALDMLYRMSRLLTEPGNVQQRLPACMQMIAATLRVQPAFIGVAGPGGEFRIVTPAGEFPSAACVPGLNSPAAPHAAIPAPQRVLVFPVVWSQHTYGHISIEPGAGDIDPSLAPVMRSAAEILASAFHLDEGEKDQRRLLLMEERAVIARELHDSLAQSLSYLKIQVSRLEALLARGAGASDIEGIIGDLREGLSSAYRQLRELLTTFRLRLEGGALDSALAAAAGEFAGRGLDVQLDYRLQHCPLAANEEIHVLQVVREALSNVARHAGASTARVGLRQLANGHVEVTVEDNGVGMAAGTGRHQHHGLVIMRERAATLGGSIDWSAVAPSGTRVTLDFHPNHLRDERAAT